MDLLTAAILTYPLLVAILYFLPSIIALYKGKRNAIAICILNLFLGWTFIGWVIALVWATTYEQKLRRERKQITTDINSSKSSKCSSNIEAKSCKKCGSIDIANSFKCLKCGADTMDLMQEIKDLPLMSKMFMVIVIVTIFTTIYTFIVT